ncbi:MAG: STAS domain-containing protein [Prevotella sp.]|nr:STAS domain-containing protein [Prevotella sp.]
MTTIISETEGRIVVALSGDLDTAACGQVERDLAPLFERDDCDIVVDCAELDYISSSGLRILLNIYKHVRKNGHKAYLRQPSDDVKEVLQIGGFLQLFEQED